MSSKFKDLMTQARNRETDVSPVADELDTVVISAAKPETKVSVPKRRQAIGHRVSQARTISPPASNDVSVPRPGVRGRPRGKRSNPDFEQITAYISKQTHVNTKIALLQEGEGREFSELVEELLSTWLQSQK